MEFRILGPIELRTDGQHHELGSPMLRRILAILALTPGEPVTVDALIDRLWGDRPPGRARSTLYTYATRLRKRIRAAVGDEVRMVYRDRGYVLETDPETIDWHRFRRLRDQARVMADSGRHEHALELHRTAAKLWRGEPLDRLTGEWADRNRRILESEREAATYDRMELELRLGHHADVIGELTRLIEDRPYDETLIGHLMLALYRSGRSADALADYRRTHRRFADELGTEPGAELQQLHRRILDRDDELDAPQVTLATTQPGENLNQLPRPVADFAGREPEIHGILTDLAAHDPGSTLPVYVLNGMPGVGKTTLAVHLAHRLRGTYPDGQYYVDLHAHRAEQGPADPSATLARLLKQLGVDAKRIPAELEERATLWRTRLAGRKILMVLDDAAGGEQIRPLLPGAPDCLVLVTSRQRLDGADGVRPCTLDGLSEADSVRLFSEIVGAARVDDPGTVAEVVRLCGRLPLAIRLVAARLRGRSAWTIRDLVERLARATDRLGELRAEDRGVRPAFELSYRNLTPEARRAFRRFSLNPGERFTQRAAAALLDASRPDTERALDELLDHHLLTEPAHGLFAFHNLLRVYATERTHDEDGENVRRTCTTRLDDYYLATAELADRVLRPHRHTDRHPTGRARTPHLRTPAEARERLDLEIFGMLAVARNRYMTIPRLAHFLAHFLDISARWIEATDIHEKVLDAWHTTGDRRAEAQTRVDVALMYLRTNRFDDAVETATAAVRLSRAIDDQHCTADALDRLGLACWYLDRHDEALAHLDSAGEIYRDLGDDKGTAEALMHRGFVLLRTDRYDRTLTCYRAALAAYRKLNDPYGQMEALNNIGDVELCLGNADRALYDYESAAALHDGPDDPHRHAILLNNIGNAKLHQGYTKEAIDHQKRALDIYQEIGAQSSVSAVLNDIGTTYQTMGRLKDALLHYKKSLSIARDVSEIHEECRSLRLSATTYLQLGKYTIALSEAQQALELTNRCNDLHENTRILETYKEIALHQPENQSIQTP